MQEPKSLTVILRDDERLIYREGATEWEMLLLLGPLSADPRSFPEYSHAASRYLTESEMRSLPWQHLTDPLMDCEDWLLIDLSKQRLVTSAQVWLPESPASYSQEEEDEQGTPVVWIHLPPWWTVTTGEDWRTSFALDQVSEPPIDFRDVLYGEAFTDTIAKLALATDLSKLPKEVPNFIDPNAEIESQKELQLVLEWLMPTIKVHTDWLMTKRADLDGAKPRDFLHRNRKWKDREMEYRRNQWSMMRRPPPAVDVDTHVYLYGPMGMEEVIVYFEMCRMTILQAWKGIVQESISHFEPLSEHLQQFLADWLEYGCVDDEASSPRELIESERRLMPRTVDRVHLDCGCPLCDLEGDEPSSQVPLVVSLQGVDVSPSDGFAFSFCETEEEWEEEKEWMGDFESEMEDVDDLEEEEAIDAPSETERGELASGQSVSNEFESVWKTTGVFNEGSEEDPAYVALLKLAFRLSEIVTDLEQHHAEPNKVERLKRSFETLQQSLGRGDRFREASQGFKEELESIAQSYPELTGKSADLQCTVDIFVRNHALP